MAALPKLPAARTLTASMFPTAWAAQEGTASRSAYQPARSTSSTARTRLSTVAASLKVMGSSPWKATPSAVETP